MGGKKGNSEAVKMFQEMDILLIQEGGCAPGYNPVTAFITYHLEMQGRKVFATKEGFKSIVNGERDIRGTAPNNQDITLAQRMAYNVASYLQAGTSRLMPAVLSGREYAIPFNEIQTDNLKEKDLLVLSNRLTNGS